MIKRAVLWLCEKTGKALLKLDDDDFRNHGLHQLLRNHGPAERVAHRVFRWMMDTINYHPAGRQPQRVICFSPHPDDDVISMGGTLIRLVEDQHEVHVAYMTSGNIAVFDHDARRVADLVTEYNRMFSASTPTNRTRSSRRLPSRWQHKAAGQSDTPEVLAIKTLIRWSEAKAGGIRGRLQGREPALSRSCRSTAPARSPRSRSPRKTCGSSASLIERLEPGADLRGRRLVRSARHAPRLRRGDLSGLGDDRAVGRGPRCCSIAERGRNGRRTRSRSRCRSARTTWPASGRPFSGTSRKRIRPCSPAPTTPREFWQRAEDRNRNTADVVQPDRPAGIFCARRLRPLERRADLST